MLTPRRKLMQLDIGAANQKIFAKIGRRLHPFPRLWKFEQMKFGAIWDPKCIAYFFFRDAFFFFGGEKNPTTCTLPAGIFDLHTLD